MTRLSLKDKQRYKRYLRLSALLVLSVLLISPLRNAVLSPFLPGAWLTHNSFRLVQMLLDNQHFPIAAPFSHRDEHLTITFRPNLSDLARYMYKKDPFHEFYRQRDLLADRAKGGDPAAEAELAMVESFKPVMSLKERAQLMFTMEVFMKACRDNDLTFFVFEGSLLGSYRHHGLVPWDDDIDIALNVSQWRQVRKVLGAIPGFILFAPSDSQWKFYLDDLPPFSDKPFKFPYLDLFFFSEHGPYVWGVTWGMKDHLMVRRTHLFPLTTVKWEMLQVPAPACVERMVVDNYGANTCVTPKYVHKTNERKYGFQTGKMDCSRLHKYYPFVFRHPASGGRLIVESREVGGRLVENVTVPADPVVCLD